MSHYRVLGILGGGGMGVVFRAEDVKLSRAVALKFLPDEMAADPIATERLLREARTASTLNHPNICTIYEVEEHEGRPFIVMELLEGMTLRDLVPTRVRDEADSISTPLQLHRIVDIALQVSEGLDAAHKKGLIHRDLKPANIFIQTDGRVKILDFGLAKASEIEPVAAENSERAVATRHLHLDLTRDGVTTGTVGYMSPEQARGERLDCRSDLYSFGIVIYEMATGRRAFEGKTASEIRTAILDQAPVGIRPLNPRVPVRLEQIVNKALERDRQSRYQTAHQIRRDLAGVKSELDSKHRKRLTTVLAVTLAILVVATLLRSFVIRHADHPQAVPNWRQRQLTVNSNENPVTGGAISPDGKYLAYTDLAGMYVKLIATGEMQAVSVPEIYKHPTPNWEIGSWLPDSTHFFAIAELPDQPSSLWVIALAGGAQREIARGVDPWGVSPDGSFLAITSNYDHEISLLELNNRYQRRSVVSADNARFRAVQWSPDGQRLAYVRNINAAGKHKAQIEVIDLNSGRQTILLPANSLRELNDLEEGFQDMAWVADGRLVFVGGEPDIQGVTCNLWQLEIDLRNINVIASPMRITNWAGFCSNNLSATTDGKKLVLARSSNQETIYDARFSASPLKLSTPARITFTEGLSGIVGWSLDSRVVFILSNREGSWGIYRVPLDGSRADPLLSGLSEQSYAMRISSDQKWILYSQRISDDPNGSYRLMRFPLAGGTPIEVLQTRSPDINCATEAGAPCVMAEPSSDSKQIVFTEVNPIAGLGREVARIPYKHGKWPLWDLSPNGNRIGLYPDCGHEVQIISLADHSVRQIHMQAGTCLQTMTWTADGHGFLAANATQFGTELVHIDLMGGSRILWSVRGKSPFVFVKPSPDGRHLAIQSRVQDSNMWMIDNF